MALRVFSGIQPTGVPHLGNYLGAIANWVTLQATVPADRALLFSVVDLHALTVPQPPSALRASVRDTAISLLAAGIDPARSTVFVQSHVRGVFIGVEVGVCRRATIKVFAFTRFEPHARGGGGACAQVPGHSELCWLLSCMTTIGRLSHMTQYKEKSSKASSDAAPSSDANRDERTPELGLLACTDRGRGGRDSFRRRSSYAAPPRSANMLDNRVSFCHVGWCVGLGVVPFFFLSGLLCRSCADGSRYFVVPGSASSGGGGPIAAFGIGA
jgi:hypothetical protein